MVSHRFVLDADLKLSKDYRHLCQIIKKLGGEIEASIFYSPKASHAIVKEDVSNKKSCYLKHRIMGLLTSGKPVLTEKYLYACEKSNKFLSDYEDFYPECTSEARRFLNLRKGVMFASDTVLVMVKDKKKQEELESILRGGGAQVLQIENTYQLLTLPFNESLRLNLILTQPEMLDENFKKFICEKRQALKIVSYFWLFAYVADPRPEVASKLEKAFHIDNPSLRRTCHKQLKVGKSKNLRKRIANKSMMKSSKRHKIDTVFISSSDDDEVDEDVVIVSVLSNLKPLVRKIPRHEIQTYKPAIDVIDLTLDDEECIEVETLSISSFPVSQTNDIIVISSDEEMEPPESESPGENAIVGVGNKTVSHISSQSLDDSIAKADTEETIGENADTSYENPDTSMAKTVTKNMVETGATLEEGQDQHASISVEKTGYNDTSMAETVTKTREERSSTLEEAHDQHASNADEETVDNASTLSKLVPGNYSYFVQSHLEDEQTSATLSYFDETGDDTDAPQKSHISSEDPQGVFAEKYGPEPDSLPEEIPGPTLRISSDMKPTDPHAMPLSPELFQNAQPKVTCVDDDLLWKAVEALKKRHIKTDECIDISNWKCRTTFYSLNQKKSWSAERQRFRNDIKKSLLFDLMETDRMKGQASLDDLVVSVDLYASSISSMNPPKAEIMSKILKAYMCDLDDAVLAQAGYELFNKFLFIFPPTFTDMKLLYHNILHHDEDESDERNAWKFLVKAFHKSAQNSLCALLALDVIMEMLQKDFEYWWKHPKGNSVQQTLIFKLFGKPNNIEGYMRQLTKDLGPDLFAQNSKISPYLKRYLAMTAHLCSFLSSEMRMSSLKNMDGIKFRFCNIVANAIRDVKDFDLSKKCDLMQISLLRPSWFSLMVLELLTGEDISKVNLIVGRGDYDLHSHCLRIQKQMATFYLHVVHDILVNPEPKKYKSVKKILKKIQHVEGKRKSDQFIRFDHKVSVSKRDFMENLTLLVNAQVCPSDPVLSMLSFCNSKS